MHKHIVRKLLTLPLYGQLERVFVIVQNLHGGDFRLVEVPNQSMNPEWQFRVKSFDMWAATTGRGYVGRGLIHTHPDPRQPDPSPRDITNASKPYWMYAVYQPLLRRLMWYSNRNFMRVQYLKYQIRR